ncbi:hypothetical protein FACS1894105_11890 [Clostridia bacterium]|nr:hypothetical protein FACS1894105_11890 [Clostridia bacterium]
MKIGVMVEGFRTDFYTAVKKAAALGADGIQAYATGGELAFDKLDAKKAAEILKFVKDQGLVFSAICGDLGGHGFEDKQENIQKVESSKRILDVAKLLDCNVVTTHIGTVPEEENEKLDTMRAACRELAIYADSIGSAFAVETGPEPASVLRSFLDSLGANGVRVNFDPANLVMCVADNPVTAAAELGKYIVHTHAKDGVMIGDRKGYEELPLGKGNVNFDTYLPALAKTGFNGFLTIEREVGDNPEADIKLAKTFLDEKLVKYGLNK